MATDSATPANPFIKNLASSNRRTRDAAVDSLRKFLSRKSTFTPVELLKLHKGLFFCMWMSDKPRVQQRLAADLADLCSVLTNDDTFLEFQRAFWQTIAREWSGIDALRMDKYLMLIRRYLGAGFGRLANRKWDEELVDKYMAVLEDVPLNARDPKVPNGLRFHVIDIFVDEIDKVDEQRVAPVVKLVSGLRKMAMASRTKAVKKRIMEALEDERLSEWEGVALESGETLTDATQDDENGGGGTLTIRHESTQDTEDEFTGFDD